MAYKFFFFRIEKGLQGNRVKGVVTPEGEIEAAAVIVNADYAYPISELQEVLR